MSAKNNTTLILIDDPVFDSEGDVTLSSHLVIDPHRRHQFFFRIAQKDYHPAMMQYATHHLFAHIMPAMRIGRPVHVQGQLQRSVIGQMELFMRYWSRWCPDRFRQISISADRWDDSTTEAPKKEGAISCFSGGVDSFYSFARLERDTGHKVKSLLFLHGFDIMLEQNDVYQQTASDMEKWASDHSLRLLKVQMNARTTARLFQLDWGPIGHGPFLAAGLHLFSHAHAVGCIPSSHSPNAPVLPWSSNPVTDPLFSTCGFQVIHHDYTVSRYDKIAELAQQDDILDHIRVCWQEYKASYNCGLCNKCMVSLLALEVAKHDSWRKAFPDVSDLEVIMRRLQHTNLKRSHLETMEVIIHRAKASGRTSLAERLQLMMKKQKIEKKSAVFSLRRWFYLKKCRLYLRYPQLRIRK